MAFFPPALAFAVVLMWVGHLRGERSWRILKAKSLLLMKPTCAHVADVATYEGWHGSLHTLRFASQSFASLFVEANASKVVSADVPIPRVVVATEKPSDACEYCGSAYPRGAERCNHCLAPRRVIKAAPPPRVVSRTAPTPHPVAAAVALPAPAPPHSADPLFTAIPDRLPVGHGLGALFWVVMPFLVLLGSCVTCMSLAP